MSVYAEVDDAEVVIPGGRPGRFFIAVRRCWTSEEAPFTLEPSPRGQDRI